MIGPGPSRDIGAPSDRTQRLPSRIAARRGARIAAQQNRPLRRSDRGSGREEATPSAREGRRRSRELWIAKSRVGRMEDCGGGADGQENAVEPGPRTPASARAMTGPPSRGHDRRSGLAPLRDELDPARRGEQPRWAEAEHEPAERWPRGDQERPQPDDTAGCAWRGRSP
jgi:hypothetical protein